jgi:MSHA biogenesis protein MshM
VRYVRFVALSEINGNPWASVAELRMVGGLCVVGGEPGSGKSVIKQALVNHDPKRLITPDRTLHTYPSGAAHPMRRVSDPRWRQRCEKRLIEEARRINQAGKMLAPISDDAHLIDVQDLRRLRLLFESSSWIRLSSSNAQ